MAGCAVCLHKNVHPNVCSDCLGGTHFKPRTKTNADRIRSMSDEELAEFLDDTTNCYCFPCTRDINNLEHYEKCKHESGSCEKEWLEWLKGDTDEDKA